MFLYEHLAVLVCLIAFPNATSSNSSEGNDTCVQKTEDGHCCKLPFVYKKKIYHSCTKVDSGLFWSDSISTYFWCYYDQNNEEHDKCETPIYRPSVSTPLTTKSTKQQISQFPSSLNVVTTSDFVPEISHSSWIGMSSQSISTTSQASTVLAPRGTKTISSSRTKQKMYIIIACSIGGGVLLAVFVVLTVTIYFKRKRKMKVTKEEENEQEMKSYRLTDESNNPVYESIDKDLDIRGNEEQQALQTARVYHELEDSQSPTSCTHEYSTPYDTSIPNNDGPNTTTALNEADDFAHLNELYEAS